MQPPTDCSCEVYGHEVTRMSRRRCDMLHTVFTEVNMDATPFSMCVSILKLLCNSIQFSFIYIVPNHNKCNRKALQ